MKININPPGSEAEHLAALNRSFGDWGDARRLQWCFARASSPLAADVIFAELNGAILAGVGISYRRLMTPAGRSMLAGILTAAWSFSVARGTYMRVVSEAARLIAERGGAVMLGFMPQDKSSGHQLLRAGAMAASTAYLWTSGRQQSPPHGRLRTCLLTDALIDEIFQRVNRRAGPGLRFVYPTREEFVGQFIDRPRPVDVFTDARDACFIFERMPRALNLLACLPAAGDTRPAREHLAEAAGLAGEEGRELLAYASNEAALSEAVAAGLAAKPAFMTVTIACHQALAEALPDARDEPAAGTACLAILKCLHVENGDRM